MIFFTKNLNDKKKIFLYCVLCVLFLFSGGGGGEEGSKVSEYSLRRIQI